MTTNLQDKLRQHVYQLADEIGERNIFHPAALIKASKYIQQIWREQGYSVVIHEYLVRNVLSQNLEVTSFGQRKPNQFLLIGAHYDSVIGSPGANDNGSGVAAMLELSRMFKDKVTQHSIRFAGFVNEEPPFFYSGEQGSQIYAKMARERGDQIKLMISLETIGYYRSEAGSQNYPPLFRFFYPDRGDFIAFVSNLRSRKVMRKLASSFRASSDFPSEHVATFSGVPGVSWSDHASFWSQGYPALMVTDTAFYRYPHYHSPTDTSEKLHYDKLAQVTQGLFKAICSLDAQ